MSAEALKKRLIPLIQGGFHDDVRCEILIYLKDHPQDDEVWRWCLATSRNRQDRLRAVQHWLQASPDSTSARVALARLQQTPGKPLDRHPQPRPEVPEPRQRTGQTAPFTARDYLAAAFIGQDFVVSQVARGMQAMKQGVNLNLLLRAPEGWGKTELASLILQYLDPQGGSSRTLAGTELVSYESLRPYRLLLIEDLETVPALETLIPLLEDGAHSFIFTTSGRWPLPEWLALRTRELTFSQYTLDELGRIAAHRLLQRRLPIDEIFRRLIARFSKGRPGLAASYGERLALLWGQGGRARTAGELLHTLNETLSLSPPNTTQNYLAVWEGQPIWAMSASEVIDELRLRRFRASGGIPLDRQALRYLPPEDREGEVGGQAIKLPACIVQAAVPPPGPLRLDPDGSGRRDLILGAYSGAELEALAVRAGFVWTSRGAERTATGTLTFPIPEAVQQAVWRRDQERCVACGRQEDLGFDFLIPVERGGGSTVRNLQVLCETCFQARQDRLSALAD
jgi:hypothetical protein